MVIITHQGRAQAVAQRSEGHIHALAGWQGCYGQCGQRHGEGSLSRCPQPQDRRCRWCRRLCRLAEAHPQRRVLRHGGLRKGVDGTGDFSHDVVNGFTGKNTVEDVKDTATNVLTDVKDTAVEAKGVLGTLGETLRGISHFLGNLFGGNGTNMFGNFLDNLVHGKVSGLGIGALIAASYLIFGRTGLLGKIGGALMAMMMVGNNAQKQVQSVAQTEDNELAREQQTGLRR